jgi:hypothetical protein
MHRLWIVLQAYDTETVEIMSGLTALAWGLWLLAPWWHTITVAPGYAVFRDLASEWQWGALFAACGAAQMASVESDSRCWRKAATVALFVGWSLVGWGFLLANPSSTAIPAVFVLALANGWAYVRTAMLRPRVTGDASE